MIDINKARIKFKEFLDSYKEKDLVGFELKVVHTYHVVDAANKIATMLNLDDEDVKLAELIALLHDIGRFEEITFLKKFDSVAFDHASWGVKMLFSDNLIREFIDDDSYDDIIRIAIDNHSRLKIEDGLDERTLLHAKIIRDADKLDNFRVKRDWNVESIFPGTVKTQEEFENSLISDRVYEAVKKRECVLLKDRVTPLDYWICVLCFIFDLNFKESYNIVKENNYVDILIDRFKYNNEETKRRMEDIRDILNKYVNEKIS